ncbi:MAG: FtsH protease activity modulator HflK [Chloroflexi bacterium]|nr:FtsH protease activity modulator HflK [Chloroflexota bacterium]
MGMGGGPPDRPPGDFGGRPGRQVDPDWEAFQQQMRDMGRKVRLRGSILLTVLMGIVVALWLITGIYSVGPGSVGVVRQFGAVLPAFTGPGLHYRLPWPIQRVDVVSVEAVRVAEIGFRTVRSGEMAAVVEEALMLTSDENIADVRAIVQYRVRDAAAYLFHVKEPDLAVKQVAEVALRGVVGSNTIDYTMVEARADVENRATEFLQSLLDSYEVGVLVIGLKLQEVDAPTQVRDAFHDVVRAREDRDRLRREAEGYAADVVPRARGEAARIVAEATAYKEQRRIRAQGDVARFVFVLKEYRNAPEVTRQRLYLEVMERVLPGVRKIIIEPQAAQGVLPLLPLTGFPEMEGK